MNLGIVCYPTFGGSGVVASELGLALAERGHQVHVFSYLRPIRIPESNPNMHFHEVEVTTYPLFQYPPYTLALATKLAVTCRETPIDVLHAHYAIPHSISTYLCRQMMADRMPKLVTTLHGTDISLVGLDESFYEITRFAIQESDGVTAVSEDLARQSREKFCITCPVKVIPNFVDTELFSPAHRDETVRSRFARSGELLVGHLSNFRSVKRVLDVVRVFHKLHERINARLLLIGDGPDIEPARNVVGELGLRERVEFLGAHHKVPEILPQLDLFLLPSEYESFGLAALEAMSCGVPIVASLTGGIPEVVEEGVSGFLCPVGDVDAMAERSVMVLSGDRRVAMGEAARRRALKSYPRDRVVDLYEAYYQSVLAAQ